MKVLIATNNKGKLREIREILSGSGIVAVSLSEAGAFGEPVEDADTFLENALIKARYFVEKTGMPTIADDSGLCVDTLGGEPGVHSARYAGENATDSDNNALLLSRLQNVPNDERTAHFSCVMVCVRPDGEYIHAEGQSPGVILHEPKGHNGFGYDPLFFVPDKGMTFAELPSVEKHAISHRGNALGMLVNEKNLAGFLRGK